MPKDYITLHSATDVEHKAGGVRLDQLAAYFPNVMDPNGGSHVFLSSSDICIDVVESSSLIEKLIEEAQQDDLHG